MEREHGDGFVREKKSASEGVADELTDIERLLGIALGCVGMSMDDFCRCTPSEFHEVYVCWHDHSERLDREMWERSRMECLCMLQPHSKQGLSAQDVMVFPWDDVKKRNNGVELSHDELMARYREAKRRVGLKSSAPPRESHISFAISSNSCKDKAVY